MQPDYPRPKPPPTAGPALLLVLSIGGAALWSAIPAIAGVPDGSISALALTGGSPEAFGAAARRRVAAHDLDTAILYDRAAAATDDQSPHWPVELARLLARTGRCEQAAQALSDAQRRRWAPRDDELQAARRAVATCQPTRPAAAPAPAPP